MLFIFACLSFWYFVSDFGLKVLSPFFEVHGLLGRRRFTSEGSLRLRVKALNIASFLGWDAYHTVLSILKA